RWPPGARGRSGRPRRARAHRPWSWPARTAPAWSPLPPSQTPARQLRPLVAARPGRARPGAPAGSLRLHAHAAVEPDDLCVHVAVAQQLDGQRGELLGDAEALGEQHVLLQLLLEGLRGLALAVDRRVDQAGGDAVDPHADGGQVAGDGERHADDTALGGRVGGLADLAVEGGDRGDGDDGAALAVGERLGLRHGGGGQTDAVEGADEVDLDALLEDAEVVGRAVLAVLADGAGGPAEPGRRHQRPQRPHLPGGLDGGDDLVGVGDVGGCEDAADLLRERLALLLLALEVGADDLGAPAGERLDGGGAQPGRTAGDDGRAPVEVHGRTVLTLRSRWRTRRAPRSGPRWAAEEPPRPH